MKMTGHTIIEMSGKSIKTKQNLIDSDNVLKIEEKKVNQTSIKIKSLFKDEDEDDF